MGEWKKNNFENLLCSDVLTRFKEGLKHQVIIQISRRSIADPACYCGWALAPSAVSQRIMERSRERA